MAGWVFEDFDSGTFDIGMEMKPMGRVGWVLAGSDCKKRRRIAVRSLNDFMVYNRGEKKVYVRNKDGGSGVGDSNSVGM